MLNCTRHHTCIHIYTYAHIAACSCPLLIFLNQWRALVCRTCAPSLADTPAVVSFCCAAMGQDPSDEDLFDMIAAVDEDGSGEIGKNRSSPAEDGARASIILVATCLNDHARACLPRTETKAFTTHAHIPSRLGLSPLNEHLSAFAPSLAPRTSQTLASSAGSLRTKSRRAQRGATRATRSTRSSRSGAPPTRRGRCRPTDCGPSSRTSG